MAINVERRTERRTARRGRIFGPVSAPGRVGQDLAAAGWTDTTLAAPHIAPARPKVLSRPKPSVRVPPLLPLPPRTRAGSQPVGARDPLSARLALAQQPGPVDMALALAVAALLLMGLIMVFSASQYAVDGDPAWWLRRQAIWAGLGLIALTITSRVDYHLWRKVALPLMGVTVTILVLVLVFGRAAYGAQRWLRIGFVSFQPSEVAKLALVLFIAEWLVRKGDAVKSLLGGLLPFAAITGVILALILLQNDMGTSLVVAAIALAMFFAAGANLLQLVPTLALGGAIFWIVAAATPFRRARLDAFLHPLTTTQGCPDGTAYQICQGLIALGSGGPFGRGLGGSLQKAGYLPNPFTDSIFAVTGEELGLVGCAFILALFAVVAFRGLRVGRRAPDPFGALLACGITCWIVAQAAINIGSVVDAIPFTGVPLPFVSFGGSSLVTSLAAVGILLSISRRAKRQDIG